ncbi:MAG: hypothetical protein ACTS5Y_03685 [Pollutimonas bauzanensis]
MSPFIESGLHLASLAAAALLLASGKTLKTIPIGIGALGVITAHHVS